MIDLHIKSNLSAEGNLSVEQILEKAEKEGFDTISIADHNSALSGLVIEHINFKKYFTGKFVSGIEIDVCFEGVTFEILGYGFEVLPVMKWAEDKFGTLAWRQTQIRDKLTELCNKKGFVLSKTFPWNARQEYAHENIYNNLMQNENNAKLFEREINNSSDFYRYSTTDKNFILYLDMSFLWATVVEAVDIIKTNGGKTFLAHPYGYSANMDTGKLLEITKKFKVDGVEVYHPRHNNEQIKSLLQYCKLNHLLVSGGSDFCGKEGQEFAKDLEDKLFI